jgi:hypothetical protein
MDLVTYFSPTMSSTFRIGVESAMFCEVQMGLSHSLFIIRSSATFEALWLTQHPT